MTTANLNKSEDFVTNTTVASKYIPSRTVTSSENQGGLALLGGENVPLLVEIGLTDLPKTGGACDSPA